MELKSYSLENLCNQKRQKEEKVWILGRFPWNTRVIQHTLNVFSFKEIELQVLDGLVGMEKLSLAK